MDSTFEDNFAGGKGGGVTAFGRNNVKLVVTGTTFVNNTATGTGGGMHFGSQPADTGFVQAYRNVLIQGNIFRGNNASNGGGLSGVDFQATIIGNTFRCNSAGNGGAVHLDDAATLLQPTMTLTFSNNFMISNEALINAGGLWLGTPSTVTVNLGNNTFYRNWAGSAGGALYCAIASISWTGTPALMIENTAATNLGAAVGASTCTCSGGENVYLEGNSASASFNFSLWSGVLEDTRQRCGSFYIETTPIDFSRKPSAVCAADIAGAPSAPQESFGSPVPFQGLSDVYMAPGGSMGMSSTCVQALLIRDTNADESSIYYWLSSYPVR
jgi:hypothetical protein